MEFLQQKFRATSLGNITLKNICRLRRLMLIRLQDEADWRPFKIKPPVAYCSSPERAPGDKQQLLSELLLKQVLPQRHLSQVERSTASTSQQIFQLNYAVAYLCFLSVFQCFSSELLEMGWSPQLPSVSKEQIRAVDLLLPLLRQRLPTHETICASVVALKRQWKALRQQRSKQQNAWLQYILQRTFVLTIVLGRVAFYAEHLHVTERLGKITPPLSPEMLSKRGMRVFCRLHFIRWIHLYVERKQHEHQICLNCEKAFPSNRLTKHIKVCKQIYDLEEYTESLDAEISAKLQDLKQYVMDVRKLQLEKEKEREQEKARAAAATTTRKPFFKKGLSKTVVSQVRRNDYNQFGDDDDDDKTVEKSSSGSDSECSEASGGAPKGPTRNLSDLTVEELMSYLWVLDQMKTIGNKVRQQRESTNLQLMQELRNFKSTVEPKFRQLNVASEEAESIMRLLVDRVECMEKERKLRKQLRKDGEGDCQIDSFCSEFQNFRSNKTMKSQRSLYKKQLQHNEQNYFSEEESSVRMSEPDLASRMRVKDFKKIRMLGRGKYGEVWEVRKKQTKVRYAMKIVYVEDSSNYTQLQDLQAECNVFSVVDSPFLVKAVYSFPEGNHHYFIMEFMPNGDFADLLQRESRLYEDEAKLYLAEVVLAIEALHKEGIIHRDIKPQNIVIDASGHIKITDYGLSEAGLVKRKQDEQKSKTLSKFILKELKKKDRKPCDEDERIVGSPYYMAPEVLSGSGSTPMSDWWSFGVLVYHTLLGVPPFTGNNLDEIKEKVFKAQPWPSCVKFGEGEDTISYAAKDLIDHLLKLDPKRRMGTEIDDIKEHPFFDGIDWDKLREQEPPISFEAPERSVDDEAYLTDDDVKDSHCGSVNHCTKLIRRDVLKSQTQEKHMRGQERSTRLLAYAQKLQKTCRIA